MSTALVPVEPPTQEAPFALTPAQARLRQMVLNSVPSLHSKRNYAKALDDLFVFCASRPLSRALLLEYRSKMDHLAPSTINVRMSATRKLVGEARRLGVIELEQAANLTDIPMFGSTELVWATGLHASRPKSCSPSRTAPPSKANATT